MCVRPRIECANVRACEAKNRRNSQFANFRALIGKFSELSGKGLIHSRGGWNKRGGPKVVELINMEEGINEEEVIIF